MSVCETWRVSMLSSVFEPTWEALVKVVSYVSRC